MPPDSETFVDSLRALMVANGAEAVPHIDVADNFEDPEEEIEPPAVPSEANEQYLEPFVERARKVDLNVSEFTRQIQWVFHLFARSNGYESERRAEHRLYRSLLDKKKRSWCRTWTQGSAIPADTAARSAQDWSEFFPRNGFFVEPALYHLSPFDLRNQRTGKDGNIRPPLVPNVLAIADTWDELESLRLKMEILDFQVRDPEPNDVYGDSRGKATLHYY
jgi:hypothetical protein